MHYRFVPGGILMIGWALSSLNNRSSRGSRVFAAVAVCATITSCAATTIDGTATAAAPMSTPQTQSLPRTQSLPPTQSLPSTQSLPTTQSLPNASTLPAYPVSTDSACPAYRSIETVVDDRLDSHPSSRALLAEKYGSIADTVEDAIAPLPDSDGKSYLRTVADTGARMRSELEQGTATDDSNEQLRLRLVDSWIAMSFTC